MPNLFRRSDGEARYTVFIAVPNGKAFLCHSASSAEDYPAAVRYLTHRLTTLLEIGAMGRLDPELQDQHDKIVAAIARDAFALVIQSHEPVDAALRDAAATAVDAPTVHTPVFDPSAPREAYAAAMFEAPPVVLPPALRARVAALQQAPPARMATMLPPEVYRRMRRSAMRTPDAQRDAWRWNLSHHTGDTQVRYDRATGQFIDTNAVTGEEQIVLAPGDLGGTVVPLHAAAADAM